MSRTEALPCDVPCAGICTSLNLIGHSEAFRLALALISRIAANDATVLILGETGTGKEVAARAIHYLGSRRDAPFIAMNCGSLPDELIESQLFGHRRGAFTDAHADQPGLLGLADRGTIFLDEIDSMSLRAQVALLRFLEERRFRPLGARSEQAVDVRVIAAANRSLDELCRRGEFRRDLYYRLNLIVLELPPLRDRAGDPELLAEHFLQLCAARYAKPRKGLHKNTVAWMNEYGWPGNVRELENLMHREFLLGDKPEIVIHPPGDVPARGVDASRTDAATEMLSPYAVAKARALEEFDRRYLTRLLSHADGNVTRAALIAGKERRAMGRLFKRYRIQAVRAPR